MGKPMEIAITDVLKVGQLVRSRAMQDKQGVESLPYGDGEIGVIVSFEEVPRQEVRGVPYDGPTGHVVKILWQHRGTVENMPDWYAAELLEPLPS